MFYKNSSRLRFKFGVDLARDNVIWVSGSGRSGTSWLANSINYNNDYRYIFEPLNPNFLVQDQSKIEWAPHQHQQHTLLESIIQGKISNNWVNSRNRQSFARGRLIKSIRSNLMIPWINKNFPNVRVVIITRNPLAIAASRKGLQSKTAGNWIWEPSLRILLEQRPLKKLLDTRKYKKLYDQVDGGIVRETIAEWVISNLVALKQCDPNLHLRIHYESLVERDSGTISGLCDYVRAKDSSRLIASLSLKSETDRNSSEASNDLGPVERWRVELEDDEISWATEFLEGFDLSSIYSSELEPVV